jgi:heptosyltransferase-2
MNEKEAYKLRNTGNPIFNYYFDKVTGFFIKSEQQKIKNPRKILFIRNDHIGDMVYSTQIYREMKKLFPKIKIAVLATNSNKDIIEKDKNVDKIIVGDLFWRRGLRGFLDYFKILREIKKENFDIAVDFRRSKLNMFFYMFLPGIKTRASYYNINGGKAFLTNPILYDKKLVNVKDNVRLVNKVFNINIKNYWPKINTDEEDEKDVKKFLRENKIKDYAVFAPGATTEAKRWPEKKFDELIDKFHKKYKKYKIVLSGANSDKQLIDRLCKNRDFCIPLINFNLRKMALVFKYSKAVVANDGCGTDISWVAGGKLVSLVGPVDRELHIPQKNTIILHHKLPCYPCDWSAECKKPYGKWCMDLITVDEVMSAINKWISKK